MIVAAVSNVQHKGRLPPKEGSHLMQLGINKLYVAHPHRADIAAMAAAQMPKMPVVKLQPVLKC